MTLHELIRNQDLPGVEKRLKENAAEIFAKEGELELTPLHVAAEVGNVEIIKLLLNTNPDIIDIPNALGDTVFQNESLKKNAYYMMSLLAEKGADIDRVDTSGAPSLYNIILQVIEDENNSGITEFHKTKLLLELGANSHIVVFGETLFDLIAEKKLSMDWWTLLLDFGAGIYNDFSKVDIDVNFLRKMTANQIVIGATKNGKPIDRRTPGFEDAHTNEEELKKAISDGNRYNFKALIVSTKHLIKTNSQSPTLITRLTQLNELFETHLVKSMQSTSIDHLLKNFLLAPNAAQVKDQLSPDLRAAYEEREKQVMQQYLRGGFV